MLQRLLTKLYSRSARSEGTLAEKYPTPSFPTLWTVTELVSRTSLSSFFFSCFCTRNDGHLKRPNENRTPEDSPSHKGETSDAAPEATSSEGRPTQYPKICTPSIRVRQRDRRLPRPRRALGTLHNDASRTTQSSADRHQLRKPPFCPDVKGFCWFLRVKWTRWGQTRSGGRGWKRRLTPTTVRQQHFPNVRQTSYIHLVKVKRRRPYIARPT